VGANWGDEGKGKITDMLAENSDIVIRFQGGANAGHTIINNFGKFALHLLPSGACHSHVLNVIGPGVALDIEALLAEIKTLTDRGVPAPKLLISDRAQVLMEYHVAFDCYEEERLGKASFGSTKSGIAPFYGDKYMKIGVQVCQMLDKEILRQRLTNASKLKNAMLENLYHKPLLDVDQLTEKYYALAKQIEPMVGDVAQYLHKAVKEGKRNLLEGQLGTLRDPDHGIFPFTTSSSPLAGFGAVGAGLPVTAFEQVIAVTKAYSSCVGAGPFTTELFGDEAEELRKRGGDAGEYGAKTGRPRRVGPLDLVATRYGVQVQGATSLALTKLDVLGYLKEIRVCTRYRVDGVETDRFPFPTELAKAEPVYESFEGWGCDISGVRRWEDLPAAARRYVEFIEQFVDCPIPYVSVGPERESIILREGGAV
jgi:adenylosuccinate synthase